MKQTVIRYNLDGLEQLKKAIGDKYVARVGILGAKVSREGGPLNNSEIGVIQLFGSITKNIPPRDFLLMPIMRNRREIINAMGSSKVKSAFARADYKEIFQLLGAKALEFVQMGFATRGWGQWAPNKPATIKAKGSDAPLIDEGQLRRAQSFDVVKKGEAGVSAAPPMTSL